MRRYPDTAIRFDAGETATSGRALPPLYADDRGAPVVVAGRQSRRRRWWGRPSPGRRRSTLTYRSRGWRWLTGTAIRSTASSWAVNSAEVTDPVRCV